MRERKRESYVLEWEENELGMRGNVIFTEIKKGDNLKNGLFFFLKKKKKQRQKDVIFLILRIFKFF